LGRDRDAVLSLETVESGGQRRKRELYYLAMEEEVASVR